MLKVEHLTKYYGEFKAVDDLSFAVDKGEIFGLLGENGAGKTTTFRVIMRLLEPTKGHNTFDDKEIDYDVLEKIGFVAEERSLLTKLTVKEQIIFYGRLKGMKEPQILEKLDFWLKKFEIEDYLNKKIQELSKGNQQKIQFISAIINDPKILILDEPFTGLDPLNVKLLKEAVDELQKKGCSIIFSSHQMEYIEEFCEKLIILVKGKVVLEGELEQIKNDLGIKKIVIEGEDIELDQIKRIDGVEKVTINKNKIEVKIKDATVVDKVFNEIKNKKVTTFVALRPTLNEIFIEKVGGSDE